LSDKKVTLSSGPFHLPTLPAGSSFRNNKILVIVNNPTKRTLEAEILVSACFPGSAIQNPVTPPELITLPQSTLASIGETNFPPHTCSQYEVFIPIDSRPILRVQSTGEYKVDGNRPSSGKLEISVVGGVSRDDFGDNSLPPFSRSLWESDPAAFIYFGDFVVSKDNDDDD
jgi:hypothetical protein